MESATRAAAEAGAVEYLREVTSDGWHAGLRPDPQRAAEVACLEAKLAERRPSRTCAQWPVIRVCIHDLAAGHDAIVVQPEFFGTAVSTARLPRDRMAAQ